MEFKESFQYPCILQVGSGNRKFKNDKELRAFLLVDKEAPAMWMTHACLQAVSNMQNMTINILTKGVPRVSTVCHRCPPNTTFNSVPELIKHKEKVHNRFETEEEKEERLQNARWTILEPNGKFSDQENKVKTPDMFVFHDDNVHYSLMVNNSHDLYDRLNKNQTKSLNKSDIKDTDINEASHIESVEGSDFKKEVARLKFKVKVMEVEQTKPLEEMRTMRIKLEKVTSENKILQEFKNLSEGKYFKCDKCDFTARSSNDIKIHLDIEHPEEEIVFRCEICGFSTNNEISLKKHGENHQQMKLKCSKCGEVCDTDEMLKDHLKNAHPRKSSHIKDSTDLPDAHIHCNAPRCSDDNIKTASQNTNAREGQFVCRDCKEKFKTKWMLMSHRRDHHPINKMCFYDAEDNCSFSADQCWYKHKESRCNTNSEERVSNQKTNELKCFTCQNSFANIPSLMEHRKLNHIETVKQCSKYEEGKCDRGQKCWYRHGSSVNFHGAQKTTVQP